MPAARQALQQLIKPDSPTNAVRDQIRLEGGDITAVFNNFPQHSDPQDTRKVLRLDKNYIERVPGDSGSSAALVSHLAETLKANGTEHDVVAVYDDDGAVLSLLDDQNRPLRAIEVRSRSVIIACRREASVDAIKHLASRLGCAQHSTVVIVTASSLRKKDANIVAFGSIEQTLRDIVHYATSHDGDLSGLLGCSDHVVIVFEESGLAYLHRDHNLVEGGNADSSDEVHGSFHFCPNFDDVAQFETRRYGRTPGQTALVLAAVVRQVARQGMVGDLAPSLRLAVSASTLHFNSGFDAADPFQAARSVLSWDRRETLRTCGDFGKTKDRSYLVSSLTFTVDGRADRWTRLNAWRDGRTDGEVRALLREVVRSGPEAVFTKNDVRNAGTAPWYPDAAISCPFLKVGALKIFDADEIQGYLALGKQIRAYLDKRNQTKPLSIAVFGTPGSGKSTAVKQLLESVRPGSSKNMLVYNLSQFDSASQLTEAFHKIQDRALELSEPPLVMFDEFDCKLGDTELGWLRYFLAPMQDGEFLGQSGQYKIGRAIFMFAGGTSTTFDDFQQKAAVDANKPLKVSDFMSRLLGFLNIRDINPPDALRSAPTTNGELSTPVDIAATVDDDDPQRLQRQVKRALTLEFQLRHHFRDIIDSSGSLRISDEIINAFLDARRYEHGVRSMEAIVKMSRPVSGAFVPASLPAKALLEMHARDFWNDPMPSAGNSEKGAAGK
jgi:hypothetical protein